MRFIGMWHDGFRWSISNSVQVNGSTLPMSVRQTRGLVREVYAWQELGGNYNYPHLEFESEICVKICFPLWKLPIHPKPPRWPQARGPRAHPVVAKTMFIRCACCLCPITATLLLRMENICICRYLELVNFHLVASQKSALEWNMRRTCCITTWGNNEEPTDSGHS